MACKNCGSERPMHKDAIVCPMCGCPTGNEIPKEMMPDKANGLVAFLSFLFSFFFRPGVIFGFALWAAKTDIQPKAARKYGLCAIIPWFLRWFIPALIRLIVCVFVAVLLIAAGVLYALYYYGIIVF